MKKVMFFLLFIPGYLYSQRSYEYAYAKYSNIGQPKCDVYIQFSADSVLDYLTLKKEKRVAATDVLSHSFEVIRYMEGFGYALISVSQKSQPSAFADDTYKLLLVFKKEKL